MHQQRPLSGRIRERSAAARAASTLHTGDPAQLGFRLCLMTPQIKPVIFRYDVSCCSSSSKQQALSKAAVSQWCALFSLHPLPKKVGCSSPWGGEGAAWGAGGHRAVGTRCPGIAASHRENGAEMASSCRAAACPEGSHIPL